MVTRHRMLFAGLALAALAAQGCGGPDIQAICEAQESCYGGNEKDIEACVIAFEAQADAADAIGCSDEFDESSVTPVVRRRRRSAATTASSPSTRPSRPS